MKNAVCFSILLVIGCLFSYGQSNQATINGTVTDAKGAVISGASVKAINTDTGVITPAKTNEAGFYSIPALPIGPYRLTIESEGFRRYDRKDITLTTSQILGLDVQLEVGAVSQSVEVSGQPPMIETQTSDIAQLIDSNSIEDLPLGDRRAMNIMALVPGAIWTGYDSINMPNESLSGGKTQNQSVWFDGVNAANIRIGTGQQDMDLPIDVVSEIKVISNNYPAGYGGTEGGVVLETTKSGTDQFHGTADESLRNDVLDAPGYFAPILNGIKLVPELRYNIFGGTVGGPIRRGKTFFFFGYRGQRRITGTSETLTVPTAQQRGGDFSQTFNAAGAVIPIYDPATTTTVGGKTTRLQFPGNIITPTTRFDPIGVNVLPYYPLPNKTATSVTGANNFSGNYNTNFTSNFFMGKVNHNFNDKNKVMARYLYMSENNALTSVYPNPAADPLNFALQYEWSIAGQYTRTLSTAAVNDLRGYYDFRQYHYVSQDLGQNYAGKLGFTAAGLSPTAFPQFAVTGFSGLGNGSQERLQSPVDQFQFVDNFLLVRGKHSLGFGAEAHRSRDHEFTNSTESGSFTFSPLTTGQPGTTASGFALASLLLGIPNAFNQNATDELNRYSWYYAAFAQDDWTVNRSLTLNLGLRWETDTPMTDSNNRMNGFNPTEINPVSNTPGVVKFMGVNGWRTNAYNSIWLNFAPRLGFAWKPFASPNTVIRGGYGIFFTAPFETAAPASVTLGFSTAVTISSPDNGLSFPFTLKTLTPQASVAPTLNDSFGAVQVGQTASTAPTYFDVNRQTGYSYEYNLGVQHQVTRTFIVEVSFLGSNGRKVPNPAVSIDQIAPNVLGPTSDTQTYRPFPQFSGVTINAPTDGISNYFAGMIMAQKRLSHGLNFTTSYTRSKNLNNFTYSNAYNTAADYGYAANDIENLFSFGPVYELPFGKGQRWISDNALSHVVGGWSISNMTLVQSGGSATATTQTNNTNAFSSGAQRANLLHNPNLSKGKRTVSEWFDTTAFAQPAAFTFGNEGVGVIRLPGVVNCDFSLLRDFKIHEHVLFQFRGDVFNAFNHTDLGSPGLAFGGAGFGTISSANSVIPPREFEFDGRLTF